MIIRGIHHPLALLVLVIAAVLTLPAHHPEARDRPGTPNNESAGLDLAHHRLPALKVSFNNTATETVTFWIEWTVNGQRMPPTFPTRVGKHNLSCTQFDSCDGLTFVGTHRHTAARGRGEKSFHIWELDYDTEYCFRFKARDEDGVVSEIWSAWACARTPVRPPAPRAPQKLQATFTPATSGRGVPGPGTPHRVLLEWDLSADDKNGVTAYVVEGGIPEGPGTFPEEATRKIRPGINEVIVQVLDPPTAERTRKSVVTARSRPSKRRSRARPGQRP